MLGSPLDKLVIIAVLTSAAASTQTTILPTARTSLSMARAGAMPAILGRIHPRFQTPDVSTVLMGTLSIVWYVGLTLVSENILFDSIAALGLMIAFYYGITGFACAIYYRRELTNSVKNFVFVGVAPVIGGLVLLWLFYASCVDLSKPENSESGDSLARGRAAARHRPRLPAPRRGADADVVAAGTPTSSAVSARSPTPARSRRRRRRGRRRPRGSPDGRAARRRL